ncbi:DUF302 domain-containing protein [Alkalimarinus alittae]|uniref:DUF302 domain-containing protein n=1 Tax=Alkalimarinus alittae TaxID=2961619 RepID=A0ABY6N454_9ALTE|nr:DUF302 domain-containing protein [Alkalimarinus alittae]UZE96905.1 DUF302 domain-containing protein [Alkalimarinus alittae]
MRSIVLCLATTVVISSSVLADVSPSTTVSQNGLISIKSNHDAKTTTDRLISTLDKKGMNIFARINHAEGAAKVGEALRPTELVIFGNPKVGTPLMQCGQSIAIDMPQKALIWEDEQGVVWFSYNDPIYIAQRHSIKNCEKVIDKISQALSNFSLAATKP